MGLPLKRTLGSMALTVALTVALLAAPGCGPQAGPESTRDVEPSGREIGGGFADVKTVTYAPIHIPDDAPVVLFLGDSITAGLHLPVDQAFPAAAQRQAVEAGTPFHIVNAGVSGDTTRGGLNRLPLLLKNSKPDIVVVELGGNDGLRGQSLKSIEENLREIISLSRNAGARVLLLQMNVPTNLGDYAKEFADMYLDISTDLSVELVPAFLDGVGGVPEMNLADGMHPTPGGHEQLAANIAQPLASMLSKAQPLRVRGD